jgi:glutathione S-transferase
MQIGKMSSQSKRPVLGYWNIRGLATAIRLLLTYAAEDFEDRMYDVIEEKKKVTTDGTTTTTTTWNREAWLVQKETLSLDFPNLPFLLDGDVRITQSLAILQYLARKHKLDGDSLRDQAEVMMILQESSDFRSPIVRLSYNEYEYSSFKDRLIAEHIKPGLKRFSRRLGSNMFFVGDHVTAADFVLYDLFDICRLFDPTCLQDVPNLVAFIERFEALPRIKAYINSDKYLYYPLNNKMAAWGGALTAERDNPRLRK